MAACGLATTGTGGSLGDEGSDASAGGVDGASAADGANNVADGAMADATADASIQDGGAADAACTADVATDPTSCGACGHDCLGGACVAGECQPVVLESGENGVRGVAVVGSTLLFTRESAGLVRWRPLGDGGATTLITTVTNPTDVTGDGVVIFVTDRTAGLVVKYTADGGLLKSVSGFDSPTGVTMDTLDVYYTIQNQDHVEAMPIDGGASVTRMSSLNYPADVAVGGGRIFASSGSGILGAPIDGGAPVVSVSPTSRFQDGGGDLIHTGLTFESGTIFFTIGSLGIVGSVPMDGGVARVLATGQMDPEGIAATPTAVYWANSGDGTIMRLAR
jgi:hypothetical protein